MSEQSPDNEMACEKEPPAREHTQDELQARYLEQQRRMQCHGCGESIEIY
ncbi:hypothetical protein Pla144_02770 [Bythopirellula polymerisocia]|uniref:Uncharacterized protein n=1 Tax=Bythopirellula polymerisocia TaxID=2528003 RepID=A0A5C6D3T2_9BACT|nr:hypothetical protein Pla144_02770 [Bythopirellula polymerisocia]